PAGYRARGCLPRWVSPAPPSCSTPGAPCPLPCSYRSPFVCLDQPAQLAQFLVDGQPHLDNLADLAQRVYLPLAPVELDLLVLDRPIGRGHLPAHRVQVVQGLAPLAGGTVTHIASAGAPWRVIEGVEICRQGHHCCPNAAD